ncbi:MAG: hypothetical protein FWF49_05205 [Oscillospiraceae bacterium]|nr:hypothetical protein [Oscillospiraceae bacterium]
MPDLSDWTVYQSWAVLLLVFGLPFLSAALGITVRAVATRYDGLFAGWVAPMVLMGIGLLPIPFMALGFVFSSFFPLYIVLSLIVALAFIGLSIVLFIRYKKPVLPLLIMLIVDVVFLIALACLWAVAS